MKTKEEYYDLIMKNRELASDPQVLKCTCPNTLCDWHGKCGECVALHRYHCDHLPFCLQPIINEKIKSLAGVVEKSVVKKDDDPIPMEYRQYVKDRNKQNDQ